MQKRMEIQIDRECTSQRKYKLFRSRRSGESRGEHQTSQKIRSWGREWCWGEASDPEEWCWREESDAEGWCWGEARNAEEWCRGEAAKEEKQQSKHKVKESSHAHPTVFKLKWINKKGTANRFLWICLWKAKNNKMPYALSLLCFRWVDLELLPPAEEKVLGEEGTHQEGVSDLWRNNTQLKIWEFCLCLCFYNVYLWFLLSFGPLKAWTWQIVPSHGYEWFISKGYIYM